jgi:translocation and assembly module TamB
VRELALTVGSGSVEGSWGYGGSRGIGHVRATDLPLDLAALVSEKLLLGGRVSGELARRSRGEDLAVALRTEDAKIVTSGGARSAHGFEVDLTASAGAWKSQVTGKVTAATNDSTLDVDAELPFGFVGGTTRGDLRGRVTGTLDANLIDDLVLPDNERLAGRLGVDLALAGSLEAPRADGRIAGALAYTSGATGMTLRLEEIELAASGGRIDVVRLRGTDGRQGRIEGTGTVLLATRDAPTRFDLRASFTDTYVARLDEVELRGSGALALSGPADALALTGNFRSDEATIRIPDRLPPDVATLPVEHVNLAASRRAVEEPAARTPREPILLDVEIAFPSRLRVEDPNLDSEWRGTLYVRGDTSKPDIQGELQVVRGRFELAGIRFTADEGRLTFDGDTNVPMLDVVAEASRNDIEATLRLQGPANAPVVTLTSTPALPQDEILSRLMFGETAGTLTPGQSIQLAQAAARLSGGGQGIGSAVLRRIRRLAGVDRIEIRDSGDPENAGTAVSVGKYLGDRVYLSYDQAVHGQGSKARVEVEMTKHLSVETEVGQSENASVGFRWRWNY